MATFLAAGAGARWRAGLPCARGIQNLAIFVETGRSARVQGNFQAARPQDAAFPHIRTGTPRPMSTTQTLPFMDNSPIDRLNSLIHP